MRLRKGIEVDDEPEKARPATFVASLEGGKVRSHLKVLMLVEVDALGASVGIVLAVGTGLSVSFWGTAPFLFAIALFLVEPFSQLSFPVWRDRGALRFWSRLVRGDDGL